MSHRRNLRGNALQSWMHVVVVAINAVELQLQPQYSSHQPQILCQAAWDLDCWSRNKLSRCHKSGSTFSLKSFRVAETLPHWYCYHHRLRNGRAVASTSKQLKWHISVDWSDGYTIRTWILYPNWPFYSDVYQCPLLYKSRSICSLLFWREDGESVSFVSSASLSVFSSPWRSVIHVCRGKSLTCNIYKLQYKGHSQLLSLSLISLTVLVTVLRSSVKRSSRSSSSSFRRSLWSETSWGKFFLGGWMKPQRPWRMCQSDFWMRWLTQPSNLLINLWIPPRYCLYFIQASGQTFFRHSYFWETKPTESLCFFCKNNESFGASLQSNFAPVDEVGEGIEIHQIEGAIPEDFPEGVYIRNGDRFSLYLLLYQSIKLGSWLQTMHVLILVKNSNTGSNPLFGALHSTASIFGQSREIWVEGEGMLHALYFTRNSSGSWSVSYANRYVQSETLRLERARQKPCFLPAIEGDSAAIIAAYIFNFVSNTLLPWK